MSEVLPLAPRDGFPAARTARPSASDDVLAVFKRMIRERQLRPGQRLPNERHLAAQLGVSRPSLREAICALAAMNILHVRPGDGTYVSSLDAQLLAEPLQLVLAVEESAIFSLFEVRRIVEPATAALAAERATDDELRFIRAEMERGIACQADPEALITHDTELHRLVYNAAHNPLLLTTSASLANLVRHARLRTVRLPENAQLTVAEHQAFVDAICMRRPKAASAAMTAHLERIERHLRAEASLLNAPISGSLGTGFGIL
jgi:GntR family transcriptional repressor for pyruvate dehydrogenase complex